jgi:hypothetical protein
VVCTYSVVVNLDITNLKGAEAVSCHDLAADQDCQ